MSEKIDRVSGDARQNQQQQYLSSGARKKGKKPIKTIVALHRATRDVFVRREKGPISPITYGNDPRLKEILNKQLYSSDN